MVLSDGELIRCLEVGEIRILPAPDPRTQLQPASIDLRLGYEFQTYNHNRHSLIDPADPRTFESLTALVRVDQGDRFIVHPGEFILATTLEYVAVPKTLVARLDGRSSIGRLGIVIHSTAGFIDPGFEGNITLEISNLGRIAVALYPGMRICQISFEKMSSEVQTQYGSRSGSKYQDQRSTTGSKLFEDEEFTDRS